METNLSCNICLQDYDTVAHVPLKVGKCGHVICKQCVDKIFIANRGVVCPFDKQLLGHPTKSLIHFPRHFEILRKVYLLQQQKQAGNNSPDLNNPDYIALDTEHTEEDPDTYINQKLKTSFDIATWRGGYSLKLKEAIYDSDPAMQQALNDLEEVVKNGYGFYLTSINIKSRESSSFESLLQSMSHLQSLLRVEFELTGQGIFLSGFLRNVSAITSLEELSIKCKAEDLYNFPEVFEEACKTLAGLHVLTIDLSQSGVSSLYSLSKGIQELKELRHFELNLSGNSTVPEEELFELVGAVSKLTHTTTLSLNFKEVAGFSNKVLLGIKPTFQSLPDLTYLYLDFSNNKTVSYNSMLKFIDSSEHALRLKIFTINVEGVGFTANMIQKISDKLDELGDQVFTRIRPSVYEMNALRSKEPLGPISVINIPLLIFALPAMFFYFPMILAATIALCLQDKNPNAQQFAKVLVRFPYYFFYMLVKRFISVCNLILRGKLFNKEALLDICVEI